jgi:hypothetical protein
MFDSNNIDIVNKDFLFYLTATKHQLNSTEMFLYYYLSNHPRVQFISNINQSVLAPYTWATEQYKEKRLMLNTGYVNFRISTPIIRRHNKEKITQHFSNHYFFFEDDAAAMHFKLVWC